MRIDNLKMPVTASVNDVRRAAEKRAGIKNAPYFRLLKKSVDARDKNNILCVYSAEVSREPLLPPEKPRLKQAEKRVDVIIAGFGPAGMFCALYLARAGFKPVVLERGKNVDERQKSVNKFVNEGFLDINSNIQFGEGGAGTFSDGKLNTGVNHPLIKTVLRDFVEHGAPEDIEYLAKPHIGSDRLPAAVKSIREEIERLGGKVLFSHKLEKINVTGGKVTSVTVNGNDMKADAVVTAIGHSARDTFYSLLGSGVTMERKAFAVGVRIEHKRRDIDVAQYGEKFADLLPAADYRLASHKGNRGVFTFCMCPGGYVMPSASEEGMVVTNGMSLYARDGENSNSAVLCEVYPADFYDGILGGAELQRDVERAAFRLGGGGYKAPVQTVKDFFDGRRSERLYGVKPTYSRGFELSDLNEGIPRFISDNLKTGIKDMGAKLKGFDSGEAVLTGYETRSSSPVRILRGDNAESVSVENLFPCGEGCGYAGGIMSAAVDGIKTAIAIADKFGADKSAK